MNSNIFSIDFRTASYDVGGNGQISITSLLRYFQEAAHEHANKLEVGFQKLQEQNLFWVLSAISLEIDNLPGFDELITVNTWPRGINKFYCLRDFLLYHNNKIVAKATSLWLLIDVKSKRIVRPERIIEGIDFFSDKRVFEDDFVPIDPIKEKKLVEERRTRYSDLDINRHVNNVRYVEWVLDTVHDVADNKQISSLIVQYLGEFVENDKTLIYSEIDNNTNEIKIEINRQDGKIGIRALIGYSKLNLNTVF